MSSKRIEMKGWPGDVVVVSETTSPTGVAVTLIAKGSRQISMILNSSDWEVLKTEVDKLMYGEE